MNDEIPAYRAQREAMEDKIWYWLKCKLGFHEHRWASDPKGWTVYLCRHCGHVHERDY